MVTVDDGGAVSAEFIPWPGGAMRILTVDVTGAEAHRRPGGGPARRRREDCCRIVLTRRRGRSRRAGRPSPPWPSPLLQRDPQDQTRSGGRYGPGQGRTASPACSCAPCGRALEGQAGAGRPLGLPGDGEDPCLEDFEDARHLRKLQGRRLALGRAECH